MRAHWSTIVLLGIGMACLTAMAIFGLLPASVPVTGVIAVIAWLASPPQSAIDPAIVEALAKAVARMADTVPPPALARMPPIPIPPMRETLLHEVPDLTPPPPPPTPKEGIR